LHKKHKKKYKGKNPFERLFAKRLGRRLTDKEKEDLRKWPHIAFLPPYEQYDGRIIDGVCDRLSKDGRIIDGVCDRLSKEP
jgi:hypothetical protein